MKEDGSSNVMSWLIGLYVVVAHIMAVVFFIQYCKTDELWMVLLIDPFLASFKGMLWILFIWW